MMPGQIIGHLY